jgi:hypothetical protein
MTPELSALVARVATAMEKPNPTSADWLAAMHEVAEQAAGIGDRIGFARGVIQGQNHMASLTKSILRMSAP